MRQYGWLRRAGALQRYVRVGSIALAAGLATTASAHHSVAFYSNDKTG